MDSIKSLMSQLISAITEAASSSDKVSALLATAQAKSQQLGPGGAVLLGLLTLWLLRRLRGSRQRTLNGLPLPPQPAGQWPVVGHLPLLGMHAHDTHKLMQRLAGELGPVYMLQMGTERAVVISNEELAREALIKRGKAYSGRFVTRLWSLVTENGSNLAMAPYGDGWRHTRRVAHKILTPLALSSLDASLEREAVRLLSHLRDTPELNVIPLFQRYTANVIFSKALGLSFASLDDPTLTTIIQCAADLFDAVGVGGVEEYLGKNGWAMAWPGSAVVRLLSARKTRQVDSVIERFYVGILLPRLQFLKDRLAHETPDQRAARDLCYAEELLLNGESDAELAMSMTQIKQLMADLLIAGLDTTAATLSWLALQLVNHPAAQAKAHAELDLLRDAHGKPRLPGLEDMDALPYTRAIIKEVLRGVPVGPLGLPRMTTEDTEVGGYAVPNGTQVIFDIVSIHDSMYPGAGTEFKPERWLAGGKGDAKANLEIPDGLYTFGQGRRLCPGFHLAYRELFLVTSTMLAAFELRSGDPERKTLRMDEAFGLTVLPKHGVPVQFVPRGKVEWAGKA
ncbi:hypothetical protein H9P43_003428 [Blastocladiella emersonii ATCC 22665]|nr:hypothetical protein H9P43_003428 [Blastocladiella emersonii ATCC 22665]